MAISAQTPNGRANQVALSSGTQRSNWARGRRANNDPTVRRRKVVTTEEIGGVALFAALDSAQRERTSEQSGAHPLGPCQGSNHAEILWPRQRLTVHLRGRKMARAGIEPDPGPGQ